MTRRLTGEVVAEQAGGVAREQVEAWWDGRLPTGAPAVNGRYAWTLSGSVVQGGPLVTVGSGKLHVACGTFPFRTVDCYGNPSLLGVRSTGAGHWYGQPNSQEPVGRLLDNGPTDTWCLSCTGAARTSALVPFGDYSGDGYPDLLVRDGNGGMRAYLGTGRTGYDKATAKSLSLGGGWMMHRSILAPGDVNGDGRPDILGVDTYGKLWLYPTTGLAAPSTAVSRSVPAGACTRG